MIVSVQDEARLHGEDLRPPCAECGRPVAGPLDLVHVACERTARADAMHALLSGPAPAPGRLPASDAHAALHAAGGHFVLCNAAKRALFEKWEQPPRPSLAAVLSHKGRLGLIPASIGAVVVDVDLPGAEAVAVEALGEPPLRHPSGKPGRSHLWYRAPAGEVRNRDWRFGQIRGTNGYVILWAPSLVVAARDAFGPESDESPAEIERLPGYTKPADVHRAPAAPPAQRDHLAATASMRTVLARCEAATEGHREPSLHDAGFTLGGHLAGGWLTAATGADFRRKLLAACDRNGAAAKYGADNLPPHLGRSVARGYLYPIRPPSRRRSGADRDREALRRMLRAPSLSARIWTAATPAGGGARWLVRAVALRLPVAVPPAAAGARVTGGPGGVHLEALDEQGAPLRPPWTRQYGGTT